MDRAEFTRRVAIAVAVATMPFLLWYLRSVLLIAVGAILLSVVLNLLSQPLRWCRLPRATAIVLTLLLVFVAMGGAAYVFGTTISVELEDVLHRAGAGASSVADELQRRGWGAALLRHVDSSQLSITRWAASAVSLSAGMLASLLVMIAMGAYLAAQPHVYRTAVLKTIPRSWNDQAEETGWRIKHGLEFWCMGQAIQMVIVAVLTAFAAWLIGLPSPLALGVIAGFAEFIPYAGPFIASIPALLVASALGWSEMVWTAIAYIAIQQFEGNVLLPMVQRRLLSIPPALILLSILSVGTLFGLAGVLLAAPISVIIYAAAERRAGEAVSRER